ncbi:MAG: glycosyltransferase family 39 protein, partial [Candidatus Aminicenantales bacterium]
MMTFNRKLNEEAKSSFFSREKPVFWLFFTLYLLLGLAFVFLGKFWADEGWYFGGSWLVANGHLPYQDFFMRHNPLFFYIYAVPQYFFGPNIVVGRLTSLLLMMLTFVLVWRLSKKLGGKTAALISSGLLITNLFVIYYFTTFSYRVLEACVMLLFFTILFGELRAPIKYPLTTFLLCLIVGIRYPIDIVSGLLILYLVYIACRSWQNKRVILISLSVAVLSLAAIMLPFIMLAGDQFFFGT